MAGGVQIGDKTWIGAGAVVSNHVKIAPDCMIGAGAVVVKDILVAGTYVGGPAGVGTKKHPPMDAYKTLQKVFTHP